LSVGVGLRTTTGDYRNIQSPLGERLPRSVQRFDVIFALPRENDSKLVRSLIIHGTLLRKSFVVEADRRDG
jgi:hypothetical protein